MTTLSALAFRDASLLRPPKPATAQTQTLPAMLKTNRKFTYYGQIVVFNDLKNLSMKSILLSLYFISTFSVFAQENRTMVSFTAGLSYPISKFGSKELDMEGTGLANRGTLGEFTISHQFKNQPWGLLSSFNFSDYAFDNEALEAELDSRTDGDWTVSESNYKITSLNFGLSYNLQLGEKIGLSFRGMTGLATTTFPSLKESWTSQYYTPTSTSISGSKAKSLNVLLGAAFRMKLFRSINWLIDFSFLSNKAKFDVTATEVYDGGSSTDTYEQTVNISRVNICTGIGIRF